jgi:CubicO group peptidase (beta-lactamase class C family)
MLSKFRPQNSVIVALALLCASAVAQEKPSPQVAPAKTQYQDALRLLDYWLDAQTAYDRVPALSAGVVIGQEVVWTRGYGFVDERRRQPADDKTIYSICSISKLFTSIAVMQLWESEQLSLDEDIAKVLPSLALPRTGPDSGRVSTRALLTHSAGLGRETGLDSWPPTTYVAPTREQILANLQTQPAYQSPAERYDYSNLNMIVLGEILSSLSGRSYEAAVADRILVPLGMIDTRPQVPAELLGVRLPQGHGSVKRDGSRGKLPLFDARGLLPSAGYSSTVADLARFAAWQFRLLRNGGREVLKVSTLREMHRVHWTDADGKNNWGLGFAVSREGANTVVSHAGRCPGYESAIALALKDEVGVIALANAQNAGPYTRQMRQLVLKGLKLPVTSASAGDPDIAAYTGRFSLEPWISERVIVPWGKDLAALTLPSSNPAEDMILFRHESADTFRVVRADGTLANRVTFTRDSSGAVTGYRSWNYEARKVSK